MAYGKMLVYETRKSEPLYIDITTPVQEQAGYLKLFAYLDKEWQVYSVGLNAVHKALHKKASAGDWEAAKKLITLRRTYEYEEVEERDFLNPVVDSLC